MGNTHINKNFERLDIKTFIEICKGEIMEYTLNEGDYCIVVYTFGRLSGKRVKFIYKSLTDFKEKVEEDVSNIDEMWGINSEFWIFD